MMQRVLVGVIAAVLGVSGNGGADEPDADGLIAAIRDIRLEPGAAIDVSSLRLKMHGATISLDHGVLFPTTRIGDRPAEFVFLGRGRVLMTPADAINQHQLELFTGSTAPAKAGG